VPTPSRRTVLTAGLAAGALAACTSPESPASTAPEPDADTVLAKDLLAAESALVGLIDSVTVERPRRAQRLAPARAVHEAHIALLTEAVPNSGATSDPNAITPFAGGERAALAAVITAEDALGQQLRLGAAQARSGDFAKVLASMAAASKQQSASLRVQP
jgi:hypothetical protein